jgi:hypothetical protein
MKEARYSEATARNPKNLTQSDAWKELLGKALPDKKLLQVHKKILNAQKVEHMVFPLGMDQADIKKLLNSVGCTPKKSQVGQQAIHVWFWAPDFKARANAVELAYMIKGRLITAPTASTGARTKIEPPDDMPGLFNPVAELTIRVVDGRDHSQPAHGAAVRRWRWRRQVVARLPVDGHPVP